MADAKIGLGLLSAAIVVLAAITLAQWHWTGYIPRMMGMMGFGWGFMFLMPLALLVLIALAVYYLTEEFAGTTRYSTRNSRKPLDVLKDRYAMGEITREQYLEMKKELEL